MSELALQQIATMTAEGNILKLPDEQLSEYPTIKKILQKAGGVYKRCTFVFKSDAKAIQERLCGGEVLNTKKEYQFFPTPLHLVTKAIAAADVQPHHTWLEPSAGQGAIADELMKISTNGTLIELLADNVAALRAKNYEVEHMDFLEYQGGQFDRIVANPPFTKNQDIEHLRKMYDHLKEGGVMVCFTSISWKIGSMKKQLEFSTWLENLDYNQEKIEAGEFKESGTQVATMMITIRK